MKLAKSTKSKFITANLDLAAVLVACGYAYEFRRTAFAASEFTFPSSPELEREVLIFDEGRSEMNVMRFCYVRKELKAQTRNTEVVGIQFTQRTPDTAWRPGPGEGYYTIETDGRIMHYLYGNSDTHNARIKAGNFFKSSVDAVNYRAAK